MLIIINIDNKAFSLGDRHYMGSSTCFLLYGFQAITRVKILILFVKSISIYFMLLGFTLLCDVPTAAGVLILNRDKPCFPVSTHAQLLADPGGRWTVRDVSNPTLSKEFIPSTQKTINLGLEKKVWWVRFSLLSISESPKLSAAWFLDLGRAHIYSAQLYYPDADGQWRSMDLGHPYSHDPALRQDKNLIFRLPENIEHATTFYLRLQSKGAMFLPLSVCTEAAISTKARFRALFYGLYLGIVVALSLFIFFFFFLLKERIYLWYVTYTLTMTVAIALYYGFFREFIYPAHTFWLVRLSILALGISTCAAIEFCRIFLSSRQNSPLADGILLGYMLIVAISTIFSLVSDTSISLTILFTLSLAGPLAFFFAGVLVLTRGYNKPATLYISAWCIHIAAVLCFSLTIHGLVPYTTITYYSIPIGFLAEIALLSLALAGRLKTLRREKEALLQGLDRIRLILDGLPTAIILTEPDTEHIVEANTAAQALAGRKKSEIIGKTCQELGCRFNPEERPRNLLPGYGFEQELIAASGQTIPIIRTINSIVIDGRELHLETFLDISIQKQSEKHREALIKQLKQAASEVEILQGFLPICSNCKKIRDDRGYWQGIEKYIEDHSRVNFSHSLCPACANELHKK